MKESEHETDRESSAGDDTGSEPEVRTGPTPGSREIWSCDGCGERFVADVPQDGPPSCPEGCEEGEVTVVEGAYAKRFRRRAIWIVVILISGIGLGAYAYLKTRIQPFFHLRALWEDSPLTRMRPDEYERLVERNMRELRAYRDGLRLLRERLAALASGLPDDASAMTPEQRSDLKKIWVSFLEYQVGLDNLKVIHQPFPGIWNSGKKDNWRRARSFAIAYLIQLIQLDEGIRFLDLFMNDPGYEKVLDERDREFGIPANAFARLKLHTIHVQTLLEIRLLHRYHESLRDDAYGPYHRAEPDAPDAWVADAIDERYPRVKGWYKEDVVEKFASNATDLIKEDLFNRWFPVQKKVAEWVGDTRVTGRPNLITLEQIEALQKEMVPGDIILERREWFLSNVGLPGFWPHAALYIGTPSEAAAAFEKDPDVRDFLTRKGVESVRELFEKEAPEALDVWKGEVDHHPIRVIEAVSEGVILNSLEHSCLADHVVVFRPQLSPLAKLKAILVSFRHWGKPYDFNFDFVTDDALVCTELVYKSYQPDTNKEGLSFELQKVMGRSCLPANEIVGKYLAELGTGEAELEFIRLLVGREAEGRAIVGDLDDLETSYGSPKWRLELEEKETDE